MGVPLLLVGGSARLVDRTIEFAATGRHASRPERGRWLPFSAITFGHVIVGASRAELTRLRAHERVHVQQYERLGVLFLLAYPASSLAAALRGENPYLNNHFELQARRQEQAPNDLA